MSIEEQESREPETFAVPFSDLLNLVTVFTLNADFFKARDKMNGHAHQAETRWSPITESTDDARCLVDGLITQYHNLNRGKPKQDRPSLESFQKRAKEIRESMPDHNASCNCDGCMKALIEARSLVFDLDELDAD